jgi:DNA polymerase III delta' subunit
MSKSNFSQNWGVVGHENLVNFLKTSIKNQQVNQAYLFSGQAGLGKEKIAKGFIAALLCLQSQEGLPCRKCINCEQLEKNIYPDVIWIERLADEKTGKLKKNITIEQIREIKNKLAKSSFLNSYKIAVINRAELMSLEAANALLKLLEEPAKEVVIILLVEKLDHLPQTILSRCQKFRLEAVSRELIYDYLIDLGSGRDLANELSYLALGRPGVAINFYRDAEVWEKYQTTVKDFLKLMSTDNLHKLKMAEKLNQECSSDDIVSRSKFLAEILDIWMAIIRDVILLKNSREQIPDGFSNLWLLNQLKTAKLYQEDSLTLSRWLNLINQTKKMFKNNVNPQLALENLVLSFY